MTKSRNNRVQLTGPLQLEERSVPAVFTAVVNPATNPSGAVAELINIFNAANADSGTSETINLFAGGNYQFNAAYDRFDGGTALPDLLEPDSAYLYSPSYVPKSFTINGLGATFARPAGAPSFRFIRAVGQVDTNLIPATQSALGPTISINDMTFDNGNTYDYSYPNLVAAIQGVSLFPVLDGGAIRLDNASLITSGVDFIDDTTSDNGGAVALDAIDKFSGTASFSGATFSANYSGKAGGGVFAEQTDTSPSIYSTVSFSSATLTGNISLTGAGAVEGDSVEVDLTGTPTDITSVTGNHGVVGGISGAIVSATDTLFQANISTGTGPSAVIATGNILTLIDSTITQNSAPSSSAVIGEGEGRAVELLNTTVDNNTSASSAIEAPIGEVVLSFSTITDNRATTGDVAGVYADINIVTIYATVIAGNRVVDTLSQNVDLKTSLVRNEGNNFLGVAPASYPVQSTDQVGTVKNNLDPKLSPLALYGGLLPIKPPAPGSPLIDAGGIPTATRITTDERGDPRVSGSAADIGAVEVQPTDSFPPAQSPLPPLVPLPPPPTVPPPPPPPVVVPVIAVAPGAVPSQSTGTTTLPQVGPGSVTSTAVATAPNTAELYATDGKVSLTVTPFAEAIPGGIRVASADVTGGGVSDLIAATGPGVLDEVAVFNGTTGAKIADFTPFPGFTGGLYVTTGDLTGDGVADIIVTADSGGGPRVSVYSGGTFALVSNFFALDNPDFRGGARAAVGDFNGDGHKDLAVAAGPGGGPVIAVYDGTSMSAGGFSHELVSDFFVFGNVLRDGVFIAAGDVNGDGVDDLIIGAGAGGGPRVLVLDGKQLTENGVQSPLADFFSGDTSRRDGVPVAARDLDGTGLADVIAGGGSTQAVSVYLGKNLGSSSTLTPDLQFDPFPTYNSGVNVG